MTKTVVVERDVMVPMRDGVRLATDVYRLDSAEPGPVLVHRNPYDKSVAQHVGSQMLNPIVAAEHGYTVVVQDCRGCFASEGVMDLYSQEFDDGYDCVEWAATQPWSNGRVGIYGSSYMGVTALLAAVAAPPHLKAAASYLTTGNFHEGWMYTGGAFELGFNMGYTQVKARQAIARRSIHADRAAALMAELGTSGANRLELCRHLPLDEAPVLRERDVLPYWHDFLDHPTYDDYWRRLDVAGRADEIQAPILHIAGWYDQFLKGHLDLNRALDAHPNIHVRDTHRFVIGPWDHNSYEGHRLSAAGEREFGLAAISGVIAVSGLVLEWFDRWLCDVEGPMFAEPRVRYFSMAGPDQGWRTATDWPPPTTPSPWYLGDRIGLTVERPTVPGARSFDFDPNDPVPTVGGRTFSLAAGGGGVQDRAEVAQRDDVLVFESAPLDKPISVGGNVRAPLWVMSSAVDTDFTAHLVDVEPSGYCVPVADGIQRARYRNSVEAPEFLTPDEPTELTIDLWDTAYTFAAGHRIRLEISSSSFPRWSRNANAAVQPEKAQPDDLVVATNTVLFGPDQPSHLVLPTLG